MSSTRFMIVVAATILLAGIALPVTFGMMSTRDATIVCCLIIAGAGIALFFATGKPQRNDNLPHRMNKVVLDAHMRRKFGNRS